MNYLTVDLYKDFKCIANQCPNTCCAGWNIEIDDATYQKMKEREEELGLPTKDWLIETNGKVLVKLINNKCCMLDEQGLCKVVCTLGDSYLSNTCQQYPRIFRIYGNVVEAHLSISCPEIINALMSKDSVQFDFVEDEITASPFPHTQLYVYESAVRTGIIELIQHFSDIPLSTRLFASQRILEKGAELYQKGEIDPSIINQYIDSYFAPGTMNIFDEKLSNIVNDSSRFQILQSLHTILSDAQSFHEHFTELITTTFDYFSKKTLEEFISDFSNFRTHIAQYHKFYTNYWVYRTFSDMIRIPDYENITQNFIYIAVEFSLIQLMALVSFATHQEFRHDEYVFIISYVGRIMEHDYAFRDKLMKQLQENNIINPAGLLLMLLI